MSHPPIGSDTIRYDNTWPRNFLVASLIWGVVGMLVGVVLAVQLFAPGITGDIPWLSYGRIRPLHTNAVIFAFAGNAIFAGIYHSMQRLVKARTCDALTKFHFWGWQAIIVAAAVTLPLGITSSKEYAELEWPIDIAIAVVWLGFGANMLYMVAKRREPQLYVAVWFYLATFVGITLLHVVNSLAVPVSFTKSYSVFAGVQDALVQWWYAHNAVAFFLTTPFLGLMYYYVPKAADRPVYSYRLSIIHFWSLIFLYIWAGPHHLLNQATPEWAQSLGMVFSIMLLAPSWGGMINGFLTLRGAYDKVRSDPVLKFFVAGITFYGMSTFEGPLLSIRSVNALAHGTDWTIGHVHSGALGWNGLMVFGLAYWLIPKLYRTGLHSVRMANLHFWLATVAIALYAVSMWFTGVAQGLMQLQFDAQGNLLYKDWLEIVRTSIPGYWVRAAAGAMFLAGMVLCLWNVVMTMRAGSMPADDEVVVSRGDFTMPPAAPATAPLRERVSVWHSLLERVPGLMIVLMVVGLVLGSLAEILPSLMQGALTPRSAAVKPYTPLELAGRDLYIREGCAGCHTQMVRTLRGDVERYGSHSTAAEGIYERPFLWGSKRTGPDLAREGVLKPGAAWHWAHLIDPQAVAPGSVMPAYPWLERGRTDYASLPAKMSVLAMAPMLTPYSKQEIEHAERDAKAQAKAVADELRREPSLKDRSDIDDSELVAMIAYLKRLGTDLEHAKGTP